MNDLCPNEIKPLVYCFVYTMDIKLLCTQIQNLPERYHSAIMDIFIHHQCVVNETKRGAHKGVRVVMDYVPDHVLDILQKRVDVIMQIEQQNIQIKDARSKLNQLNPELDAIYSNTNTQIGLFGQTSTPIHSAPHHNPPLTLAHKISALKMGLYHNQLDSSNTHRSASSCLWCTLPILPFRQICIPTHIQLHDGEIDVSGYGSFCRPECAAGKLMNEPIDISTKYERYMLLNQLYMKQFTNTGIVPAVSPHYVMDKFLGTLTPDEYLEMTGGTIQYNILKKPFTHIMPELHEKYIIAHE